MFNAEFKNEKKAIVVLLLVLLYLFFQLLQPFLMALILSGIFVVLFYGVFAKLKDKLRKPRLAAFLVSMAIFLIILLPATLTISLVVNQTYSLLSPVDMGNLYQSTIKPLFDQIAPFFDKTHHTWPTTFNFDVVAVLSDFAKQIAGSISRFSPTLVLGTAGFFFSFFIMLVCIYFLFLEGPHLLKVFFSIAPMRESYVKRLLKEVKNTVEACVYGYLVTSLVQALLASFAFWISGIPGFAVLGTLTFFMSMVPIVGAAGVWLPICVVLFLNGQMSVGLFNVIWGVLVISGIDNILKPLIIQGKTSIHPLLVFFSLFGGIAWFGPLGILFGPVITSVLLATIKIYREEGIYGR